MKQSCFKTIALVMATIASQQTIADLYTPKAVLANNNQSDLITAKVKFPATVSGDLYVAALIGGQLYFFADNGSQFTTDVLPYQQNTTYSSDQTLFSIKSNGIPAGNYPLFQVVVKSGLDPLNFSNWVGGVEGLSAINFNIGHSVSINGDFDDNGFADDDANHDGFHDDDLNKDGFHDDDMNHDGYHDNDLNKNGIPDPQENNGSAGKSLYESNSCATSACHGSDPGQNINNIQAGTSVSNISDAISSDKGGMGFLSYLTDAEIQQISDYLKTF